VEPNKLIALSLTGSVESQELSRGVRPPPEIMGRLPKPSPLSFTSVLLTFPGPGSVLIERVLYLV
jgi:hypothetical protein